MIDAPVGYNQPADAYRRYGFPFSCFGFFGGNTRFSVRDFARKRVADVRGRIESGEI